MEGPDTIPPKRKLNEQSMGSTSIGTNVQQPKVDVSGANSQAEPRREVQARAALPSRQGLASVLSMLRTSDKSLTLPVVQVPQLQIFRLPRNAKKFKGVRN